MKKIGVLVSIMLLVAIFLAGCTNTTVSDVVEEIEEDNGVKEVVIYEFYGATCPHCKSMNAWF
ncbi:hypothetical protein KY315_03920, partial [Candidatus Woesearchaeota archaeon]|nr:hypothetical protein [Candidatus Woesearchaeota archaeon]